MLNENVIFNLYIQQNQRALEEKRARLGLVECVNHELLQPYPVLHEKPDKSFSYCLAKGGNLDPFFVNGLVTVSHHYG